MVVTDAEGKSPIIFSLYVVRHPRQMTKKAFVGVNIIYASVIFAFVASFRSLWTRSFPVKLHN